jgi:hypothetical protein
LAGVATMKKYPFSFLFAFATDSMVITYSAKK